MLYLLKDKNWLEKLYVDEKKTLKEIAQLSNTDRRQVRYWTKKFGLKNGTEYHHGESVYKELNDREWLYNKYFVENLSTLQIRELLGIKCSNSVKQAIERFGWKTRNQRDGITRNTLDVFIDNPDFINGSLLGDGSLSIYNRESPICCPFFHKKNKYEDHLQWFASHLLSEKDVKIEEKIHRIKSKDKIQEYNVFTFRTLSTPKLMEYYRRWYPKENEYKKVVPKNLILTPTMILNWFLDDGSTTWRDRQPEYQDRHWCQRTQQILLSFSSESFTKDENQFLAAQLMKMGLNAKLQKTNSGTGWRVTINQSSVNDFFDMIGDCPVPSMEYKWKRV